MSDFDEKMMQKLKRLEREVERLQRWESGKFIALTTPLTSTDWDGDAFSTTNKTKIDLSVVFGVPAGVKAVYVFVAIKDSASSTTETYFRLSPNSFSYSGLAINCGHLDDVYTRHNFIVPCDSNGDIYYEIMASGTDTMDVYMEIWGYWL